MLIAVIFEAASTKESLIGMQCFNSGKWRKVRPGEIEEEEKKK